MERMKRKDINKTKGSGNKNNGIQKLTKSVKNKVLVGQQKAQLIAKQVTYLNTLAII